MSLARLGTYFHGHGVAGSREKRRLHTPVGDFVNEVGTKSETYVASHRAEAGGRGGPHASAPI